METNIAKRFFIAANSYQYFTLKQMNRNYIAKCCN